MRIFMSLMSGLIVFAGTGGVLTAWFAALILTPGLADAPGSFLAKNFGMVYIVSICFFSWLTWLSARGVFRAYDLRVAGGVTVGNILAALFVLPLVIAGYFYSALESGGAILVVAVSLVPVAVILIVLGVVVRLIDLMAPRRPVTDPER